MWLCASLLCRTAVLLCGVCAAAANANPITLELFYTTSAGNVGTAVVTLNGSTLTIDSNTPIASLSSAAGIIFAPDGDLLIGGGAAPAIITEIAPSGPIGGDRVVGYGILPPGNSAFNLAVGPPNPPNTGTVLRALCNGDCGSNFTTFFPLSSPISGQMGQSFPVTAAPGQPTDAITAITGLAFDPANNMWYYGATPDGTSTGDFGTVTFGEGAGLVRIADNLHLKAPAHSVLYDPFSNDIIFDSGDTIDQFDPLTDSIVSSITCVGQQFEEASVDGQGHLFVASSTGDLLGVDYSATPGRLIDGSCAPSELAFLANDLYGVVVAPTPEPSSIALLGTALLGLTLFSRRRCPALP